MGGMTGDNPPAPFPDLRNIERTRLSDWWRPGVDPAAVVDGVCGGLRRKSLRMSWFGRGSDMLLPKDWILFRAALLRWAPSRQMPATESRIPTAMPGKKPARTAPAGNLSHSFSSGRLHVSFVCGEFDGVAVVSREVREDVVEEDGLVVVLRRVDVGEEEAFEVLEDRGEAF
ncbi:hypothetical protein PVAG01_10811 [Phlyctema vagabunda]|uniref:Uncharacterized protein n=1 Tax=Phlyctema vagabunda TaxID=108571 RepID=A0ABR4P3P5_9HELO